MNKKLVVGALAGFAVVGVVAAASKKHGGAPAPTMWDKMREHMDDMPADFPPRVMFDNVEATKANTEQILDMLRTEHDLHRAEALGTS